MKNNLISVIIPMYNAEKTIEKCIRSLVNQNYRNIEILAINDGSKDNTLEICKKLQKEDHRIKIIDKENGGVSSTRNTGIEKANRRVCNFY